MGNVTLGIIMLFYLAIIFLVAFWAEKHSKSKWVNNPFVYVLSLAVYCSAWTYYGSIGIAANTGIDFLPIYLGPVIAFPLWIVVMRKVIKISKHNKITSIADFISFRYGNSRFLGGLVTLICVLATVPYISLQLKALSESYRILIGQEEQIFHSIWSDYTFYIALALAIFATFYGTRHSDASEKNKGIVFTTAFESIIKLAIFLIVGIYVTFFLFDGTTDIYDKISQKSNFENITQINSLEHGFSWFFMIMLSFISIFLLPRQFHMSVVENNRENHIKHAIWLFPLYLLLFNVFVIFIAWGGLLSLGEEANAEYFTLLLPLQNGNTILALLVFIGGLSAVISMVIVSTLALSTMVSNNLVIPYGYLSKFKEGHSTANAKFIKKIRRISIFFIIIFAYIFYVSFSTHSSLYSIGLISFVIIAQLAPSFFIGLYSNRGTSKGAVTGIIIGFLITGYTLILPFTLDTFSNANDFIANGLNGIKALKPNALFGLDFLSPAAHAFFWSIIGNTLSYLVVSVVFKGNQRERNHGRIFLDVKSLNPLEKGTRVFRGEAFVSDIKKILFKFLGAKKTEQEFKKFFTENKLPFNTEIADTKLINYSEQLLTGIIGSASAKILVSSVVKEEEISLPEVLEILGESKENIEVNKLLQQKTDELAHLSEQLKIVNKELIIKDQQKDDFLDTVAHELKTPITGIRAATEILLDDFDELSVEYRTKFLENILKDSDRLARLIDNILDFEKLSNGRENLLIRKHNFKKTITIALDRIEQIALNKKIVIEKNKFEDIYLPYDDDRIIQVITNILSNAIKFCNPKDGLIKVSYIKNDQNLIVDISDNGKGIPEEEIEYIFEKFYQSKNQNIVKPIGSGLGLAICKHIIDKHKGTIKLKNISKGGVSVTFTLPIYDST